MHLLHDIATAKELTFHVDLWNGRPVRVGLDLLAELLIFEHVDVLVLLDAVELQDLHNVVGEATTRHLTIAFHEDAKVVVSEPLVDLGVEFIVARRLGFGGEVVVAIEVRLVAEGSHAAIEDRPLQVESQGSGEHYFYYFIN